MALPLLFSSECFALGAETDVHFLQSVYRKRDGGARIESSADTPRGNLRARFYAEPSKQHQGLVHVRNLYNNQYWVLVQDGDDGQWYMSAADGPNEELGSEGCTLFKPILAGDARYRLGAGTIRFQTHIGGREVYACVLEDQLKLYLRGSTVEDVRSQWFFFYGMSRDKELPQYVAFKGDNGRYIQWKNALEIEGFRLDRMQIHAQEYLEAFFVDMGSQFFLHYDTDFIGDDGVLCTVITNDDGTVCIKAGDTGAFWTLTHFEWITPTGDERDDIRSRFKVVTGDGFIALQNLANQKFCYRRMSGLVSYDLLKADGDIITESSKLVIEEPLVRREFSDIKFHLNLARITNNSLVSLDRREHGNITDVVQTGRFVFTKKREVRGRWETIDSSNTAEVHKYGASIGAVPFVVGVEFTTSTEAATAKRRTESKYGSEERIITQDYTMLPGKTVVGEFVAMKASYEVPYSYKRKDILTNGETIFKVYEDGIYTGVNHYKFQIILTEY